jgi:hypothetical protein
LYIHESCTPNNVIKKLVTSITTGGSIDENWELVFPTTLGDVSSGSGVDQKAVVKASTKTTKQWVYREQKTITLDGSNGSINLTEDIADIKTIRIYNTNEKINMYRRDLPSGLGLMQFCVIDVDTIVFNAATVGNVVLVDYEKQVDIENEYYLELVKPALNSVGTDNLEFINWRISDTFVPIDVNAQFKYVTINCKDAFAVSTSGDAARTAILKFNNTESVEFIVPIAGYTPELKETAARLTATRMVAAINASAFGYTAEVNVIDPKIVHIEADEEGIKDNITIISKPPYLVINSTMFSINNSYRTPDYFIPNHYSSEGKLSWFKEAVDTSAYSDMTVEYFMWLDNNSVVGVICGDEKANRDMFVNSPFYWGSIEQLEDSKTTDLVGNFAGFSGSDTEPMIYLPNGEFNPIYKTYGDTTGTGITDVTMLKSKLGAPYQAYDLKFFCGYENRVKSYNAKSPYTGGYSSSDIIVSDVTECERGKLRNCLAVPKEGKEHGAELIYKRYDFEQETTYVFLHITASYTPFNKSPDSLMGICIKIK